MKNLLKNIVDFLNSYLWFEIKFEKSKDESPSLPLPNPQEEEKEEEVKPIYKDIQISELNIKYNPESIYHLDWSTPQEVGEEITTPYQKFYHWFSHEDSKIFEMEDKKGVTLIRRDLIIFVTIKKTIRRFVDEEATRLAQESLTSSKAQTKVESDKPSYTMGGWKRRR